MELEKVGNFKQLQDMILREQFVSCCTKDHATFLKERKPTNVTTMAQYADQYIEARGGWHPGHYQGKGNNSNFKSDNNKFKNRPQKSPEGGKFGTQSKSSSSHLDSIQVVSR